MNAARTQHAYVSTCVSGLQDPAASYLQEKIELDAKPRVLDGLLHYESAAKPSAIVKLAVFNNSFLVLRYLPQLPAGPEGQKLLLRAALQTAGLSGKLQSLAGQSLRFRIIVSAENKLVTADSEGLRRLQQKIVDLEGMDLRPSAHRPEIEFWLLTRREGCGFFMLRLTRSSTMQKVPAGSLSPQLASLLCYLAQPTPQDRFLDPCAGSGMIPIARMRHFPADMIFLADISADQIHRFRTRYRKNPKVRKKIIPKVQDARILDAFSDQFIDCIVTDPPWGQYEPLKDSSAFYQALLHSFGRVLRPAGVLVILTACKEEMVAAMRLFSDKMELESQYDILVSGKKAAVYKLRRNGGEALCSKSSD